MLPADDALQIIRDTWSYNGQFLDDLKDRLTAAQPIPLVPFVGAGLSMPMGFPSWGAFLKQLAEECGKSDQVAALLADGKFEDAAGAVEDGLGAEIFNSRAPSEKGMSPSYSESRG